MRIGDKKAIVIGATGIAIGLVLYGPRLIKTVGTVIIHANSPAFFVPLY
jgi:phosphate/sulfate permease